MSRRHRHRHRHGDLEIDEDPDFQRRTWRLQRVAWAAMALIVALGLLGLFGGGPLSHASAGDEGAALVLEYERFERRDAEAVLAFSLRTGHPGEARLHLDGEYLDAVRIERIEPPPTRQEAEDGGASYVFSLRDPRGEARVVFRVRPLSAGRLRGSARLDGGRALVFGHFVYP